MFAMFRQPTAPRLRAQIELLKSELARSLSEKARAVEEAETEADRAADLGDELEGAWRANALHLDTIEDLRRRLAEYEGMPDGTPLAESLRVADEQRVALIGRIGLMQCQLSGLRARADRALAGRDRLRRKLFSAIRTADHAYHRAETAALHDRVMKTTG